MFAAIPHPFQRRFLQVTRRGASLERVGSVYRGHRGQPVLLDLRDVDGLLRPQHAAVSRPLGKAKLGENHVLVRRHSGGLESLCGPRSRRRPHECDEVRLSVGSAVALPPPVQECVRIDDDAGLFESSYGNS